MSFFRRNRDDEESVESYKQNRPPLAQRINPEPARVQDSSSSVSFDSSPEVAAPSTPRVPAYSREAVAMSTPRRDNLSLERYRDGATTVARDTSFQGALKTEGNLFIEGSFEGELEANDTIVIAEGAKVSGQVKARDVLIAGKMDGEIHAGERFLAKPTAHVEGDVESAILVIEEGAHINCQFAMSSRGGY
ncbi:MAG: polymer-forming cytoskeletal protein [Anaerolineales bacterium]|nr:polymer-forming cytoskeletal protein [Anaerolineales bacterium]MCB9126642.1 polymer-forming cytoskeletal protein [Ardenticatenales bacterium]MCB9172732.1 polymer-forming cytoskeletal protein [Ardenticatenales bacterium]